MQHQLSWQNLKQRRKIARLLLLYKALYDHIACTSDTTLLYFKLF